MNIKWTSMTSIGPTAWNRGSEPLVIPSARFHHQEQKTEKVRVDGRQRSSSVPERDYLRDFLASESP